MSTSSGERQLVVTDLENSETKTALEFPEGTSFLEPLEAAMLPDAFRVAAAISGKYKKKMFAVWDGRSGELLQTFSPEVPDGETESDNALAISPDGLLLAQGDRDGVIHVWSIAAGKRIARLRVQSDAIHCLSFARDPQRRTWLTSSTEGTGWLLASGDAGGVVTIWDLGTKMPRSFCHGSHYQVFAVAFSQDRMTLASAGRGEQRLWDIATGRLLLKIRSGDWTESLAFSPDGKTLAAVGTIKSKPGITIWRLENGRGIKSFWGLTGQISKTSLSHDGRFVAALSHNWKVGVWSVEQDRLLHVFDAPQAIWADNAGIAFSPDAKRLAVSAGREARLWNLEDGKELRSWTLGEGLADTLVFADSNRLLSLRVETSDKEVGPYTNASAKEYPRVCPIRNLLSDTWDAPLSEIKDFPVQVDRTAISPDGKYFAVQGLDGSRGKVRRQKVFEAKGNELLSIPTSRESSNVMAFDPTGRYLAVQTSNGPEATVFEIPSGKREGRLRIAPICIAHEKGYWATKVINQGQHVFTLLRIHDNQPLVALGAFADSIAVEDGFNAAGTHVAWDDSDGTVFVAEIADVQRRLKELDPQLSWE